MTAALATLAVLFAMSAFFSGSETILFSLSGAARERIRAKSPSADRAISACMEDSALLLSTILVGNTLVNFAIATIGYRVFTGLFPEWGGAAAVPSMTIFLLLFGEITPKRIAMMKCEALAPGCARFLLFWRAVLKPVNFAFRFSAKAFSKAIERERRALSDAELVSVLEEASESGDFSAADTEMIEGVLRLSELHANDEMTPRVDIEGIDADLGDAERRKALANARHARLPLYRRTPDAIEGIIERDSGRVKEPLFVPEQITLDDLLETLYRSGRKMAVVLDEYGGTAGIITVNDIMEIVLGPGVFGDKAGDEPRISRKSRRRWIIDGDASIEEINRELGIELEAEDADRLSGWLASQAERIPHVGQRIEAQGCRATVLKRRKRRVALVELEVLKYPEADTDEEIIAETDEQVEKTEEENS